MEHYKLVVVGQGYVGLPIAMRAVKVGFDVIGLDIDSVRVKAQAVIGDGTTVWHLAQVGEHAQIGRECVIGRGAYIGAGVQVGDRCKIQNHALVYEPAEPADRVCVGPAAVFTNDRHPRAVTPDGQLRSASAWEKARRSELGPSASHPSPSAHGRWWPPGRSLPATSLTTQWSSAHRPARSAGSVEPDDRWSRSPTIVGAVPTLESSTL